MPVEDGQYLTVKCVFKKGGFIWSLPTVQIPFGEK